MLPIMAKLNVILRSESVNTWKFQLLHEKEFKVMMILSLKDFTRLILKISQFFFPTATILKLLDG